MTDLKNKLAVIQHNTRRQALAYLGQPPYLFIYYVICLHIRG